MSRAAPIIAVDGDEPLITPVAATEARTKRASPISTRTWQSHKARIEELHGSLKLESLIETIERERAFFATKAQYKRQFNKWGLSKKRGLRTKLHEHEISTSLHRTPADDRPGPIATGSPTVASELDLWLDVGPDTRISFEPLSHYEGGTSSHDSGYYSSFASQSIWEPRPRDWPFRGEWDSEGLFHKTMTPRSPDSMSLCETSQPTSANSAHDLCLTGLTMSPSAVRVSDYGRFLVDTNLQADFNVDSLNTTRPAYRFGRNYPKLTTRPGSPSPIVRNTTQTGSLTPIGDVSDALSRASDGGLNECSSSLDVDIFIDLYRGPLVSFLQWIQLYHALQMIIRFNTRSLPLSSRSSFRSHTTGDSSNDSSAVLGGLTPISSQGSSKANGKRKFSSVDGPAGQEVQNDEGTSQSLVIPRKRKVKLACHFHKRNPSKFSRGRYKTCPNGFDGLNRLKDHQTYVHRPAHYCKRCKRIFGTQDLRDAHDEQDERCQRREDPAFADYLTSDVQRAALARKKPAGMKDEDFWYEMWDKYFPGISRPASAFQDLDPTLAAFQSFAEREAVSTVQAYCEFNPTHGLTLEELTHFWHFAIYYVVADFAREQGYHQSYLSSVEPEQSQQQQQQDGIGEMLQFSSENPSFDTLDLHPIDLSLVFGDE